MLPDFLFTSYRRYKDDTDYITTWLAITAEQDGFATDHEQPNAAAEKPKKLKGRARTLARRAAQVTTQSTSPRNQENAKSDPAHTVAVKDFLPMAEHIASFAKQLVKIPKKFTRVLDRAIMLRRKVGKAIADQQLSRGSRTPADLESDSRHVYFVETLEQVRQVLGHLLSETKASQLVGPEENRGNNITNMLECLHVEDLMPPELDDDEVSPQKARTVPAGGKPESFFTTENATDSVEASVLFLCHLDDMAQMREVISTCWSEYQKGACDLTNAALTSNTAFELARQMEEDLNKLLGREGAEMLLKTKDILISQCLEESSEFGELNGDDLGFATNSASSRASFWSAYKHLRHFMDIGRAQTIANSSPNRFNPEADGSKRTQRESFLQDRQLLTDLLSDLAVYEDETDATVAPDDELTKGFIHFFAADKIPLWLVLATQVFLDTHRILDGSSANCFEECLQVGQAIMSSMMNQTNHQNEIDEPFPDFKDGFSCLGWMITAICSGQGPVEDFSSTPDVQQTLRVERDRLLTNHPVLCGVKLYSIKAMYRHLALGFVNSISPTILTCAHLHNALQMEGHVPTQWPDMSFIYALQDVSNLYAGRPPNAPDGYHTRFCLAVLGFSATNFARNRRRPQEVVHTGKGGRMLQTLTPVSDAIYVRYCQEEGRKNLATQDIQDLLEASDGTHVTVVPNVSAGFAYDMDVRKMASPASRKSTKPRPVNTQKISPADVLRNLRTSLNAESLGLSVDYLAMHQVCTNLLISIRDAVAKQMEALYGAVPELAAGLPIVVWFILSAFAAEKTPLEQNILPYRCDGYKGIGEGLMRTAAKKLMETIEKKCEGRTDTKGNELTEGNAVVARAMGFTSYGIRCQCEGR